MNSFDPLGLSMSGISSPPSLSRFPLSSQVPPGGGLSPVFSSSSSPLVSAAQPANSKFKSTPPSTAAAIGPNIPKTAAPKQRFFQEEVQALILQYIPMQEERAVSVEITNFVQDFAQSYVQTMMCAAYDIPDGMTRKSLGKIVFPALEAVNLLENLLFCYHHTTRNRERRRAIQEYIQWKIKQDTSGFFGDSFVNPLPNPFQDGSNHAFIQDVWMEISEGQYSKRFQDYTSFFEVNGQRLKLWVSLVSSSLKTTSRVDPIVSDFVGFMLWDTVRTLTQEVVHQKFLRFGVLRSAPKSAIASNPEIEAYYKSPFTLKQFEEASIKLLTKFNNSPQ
jgi:hypothetical protein